MFEIEYIYHDCFKITSPEVVMIFDYWKIPDSAKDAIPGFLKNIPVDKPVYVFVSHFHKDHFNKDIFSWGGILKNIQFIISKDTSRHARYLLREDSVYAGYRPDPKRVHILEKGDIFEDDLLKVRAFGSTDIGNSYALTLKVPDLKIFHAGDLNCWTWRDESTPEEIRQAEKAFESELQPISKEFPVFDIAMFPVDSRIGTGFYEGAARFLRRIKVKWFFPMHFELADSPAGLSKRKADAIDFMKYASDEGEYISLTHTGDRFLNNSTFAGESKIS